MLCEICVICMNSCLRYAVFQISNKMETCNVPTYALWDIPSGDVLLTQFQIRDVKNAKCHHYHGHALQ